MYDFFFDSADVEFIKTTWNKIYKETQPHHVRGVTTNPKAMDRVNCHSLIEWKNRIRELCELVSHIRGDDKGVVYVQLPNCNSSPLAAISFAREIGKWGDGQTKIGMKIPPYKKILEIVPDLEKFVETNVTGVADSGTALFAASYGVRYVSVIPGRMEEKGIDADAHLRQITESKLNRTEIIAGSMRTIDGLHRSVLLGTVPTIGGTVFKLALQDVSSFVNATATCSQKLPQTTEENIDLSSSFFTEMNKLGEIAWEEFKEKHNDL